MSFAVTNIKKQNKNILIVEPSATAVLCRFSFKCLIFFFQGMFEVELCPHWYIENFRAHRHLFYVRTEGHWTPKYRVLSIKPLSLHFHRHRGVGRAEHRVQQMRNLYSLPVPACLEFCFSPTLFSPPLQLHRPAPRQSPPCTRCLGTEHQSTRTKNRSTSSSPHSLLWPFQRNNTRCGEIYLSN